LPFLYGLLSLVLLTSLAIKIQALRNKVFAYISILLLFCIYSIGSYGLWIVFWFAFNVGQYDHILPKDY
jgi:hypothetical protein